MEKDVSFAYAQISSTASQPIGQPKNTNYDELRIDNLVAPAPGYMLVYLSNESSTIAEVYFDDLTIEVKEHPVIQTDDYYPYGMQFAGGYQRITAKENTYLYNGFELQKSLDWGVYDYQARYYDPVIGRFLQVDPAADLMRRHSPYNYAFDNPIRFIDPDGMMPTEAGSGPCGEKPCPENDKKEAEVTPPPKPVTTPLGLLGALLGFSQTDQHMIQGESTGSEPKPIGEPREEPDTDTDTDTENEYLYRAMAVDADGTPVLPSDPSPEKVVSKELGAREADIKNLRNSDGSISPKKGKGGMSTSTVPAFPKSVQDRVESGKLTIFRIKRSTVARYGLIQDKDGDTHVSIQPGGRMTPNVFQTDIMATKHHWKPFR